MAESQPTADAPAAARDRFAKLRAAVLRVGGLLQPLTRRLGNKWWILPAAAAAIGVIVLGGFTWWWLLQDVEQFIEASPDRVLASAYEALDRGIDEEARQLVESLQPWSRLKPEQIGAVQMLMGVVVARASVDSLGTEKRRESALAARYFEEAQEHGFPSGREAEGQWQLAVALFGAEDWAACRDAALAALETNPDRTAELHRMIAATFLERSPPDFDRALEYNSAYLADENLSEEDRLQALLQRVEICFTQRDLAGCRAALDQIPEQSPHVADARFWRARILIEEAAALQQAHRPAPEDDPDAAPWRPLYEQAIESLNEAMAADTIASQVSPKSMYLIGLCYQRLGDARAAIDQYGRTAQKYFNSAEATASGVMRGEILRGQGHYDQAIESYREALETAGSARAYRNDWLPLDELRQLGLTTYGAFLSAQQFEAATELARLLRSLLPELAGLRLMAEAQRQWGQTLLAQAESAPLRAAQSLAGDGREKLNEAGRMFGELADANAGSRTYTEDLWESSQCFLTGHGFSAAAKQLRAYLDNETKGQRPAALVALGTALLSLDQRDEALHYLAECIEFYPDDAARYRARVLSAQAQSGAGENDAAEQLLLDNLERDALTPASKEWRESLFALGELLYNTKRFDEAVPRLDEALTRYPQDRLALHARYFLAESHRELARAPAGQGDDAARIGLQQRIDAHRKQALISYEAVEEALRSRQRGTLLSEEEGKLLRNAHFARGALLVDLGRLNDAIEAFTSASTQYQDSPEVLLAYEFMADCYRRLNQPQEARNILQQARVLLERMKPDLPFQSATNYSRDQWQTRLNSLEELLTL